jgi:predicted N-acyltransferase
LAVGDWGFIVYGLDAAERLGRATYPKLLSMPFQPAEAHIETPVLIATRKIGSGNGGV